MFRDRYLTYIMCDNKNCKYYRKDNDIDHGYCFGGGIFLDKNGRCKNAPKKEELKRKRYKIKDKNSLKKNKSNREKIFTVEIKLNDIDKDQFLKDIYQRYEKMIKEAEAAEKRLEELKKQPLQVMPKPQEFWYTGYGPYGNEFISTCNTLTDKIEDEIDEIWSMASEADFSND